MIKVTNLTKSFYYQGKKTTIFRNLNFTIKTGESIAILGANGAGKSTLLRILGGIDLPDSGQIETDSSISWPVGLVGGFQGSLTGRENVTFVSRIYSDKKDIPEKIKYVEEFAELGVYFDRPFKTYSSGMRSRVTFGLSMAFDFDVYLIDEVTAAGDQRFREKSKRTLLERRERSDFLMVDHNLWGLQLHCDRAFILDGGRIEEFGSIDEAVSIHTERLLAGPAHRGLPEDSEDFEG
jgi:capsular polysaccharide transport system ATP-binding protein